MYKIHLRSRFVGLALAGGLLALPAMALAEPMIHVVELSGSNQVPAVDTSASGVADVTFDPDTKMLTWSVTFQGLSGEVTGAHFHGPAEPGANADVALALELSEQPISGSATLTDEQAEELAAGMWYINIHTAANSGGEIRGAVPSSSALGLGETTGDFNPFTF